MKRRTVLLATCLASIPAAADPNVMVPGGYRLDDYRAPVPDTVPGAIVVDTATLQSLIDRNAAILIDVLPAPRRPGTMRPSSPWMPGVHQALPGSLWWPETGRGALSPSVENRLRQRLTAITAASPRRVVVFYCLPDCWMSWNAARRAAAMGFDAAWYPDGVDGWRNAGLPLEDVTPEIFE